MGVLMLNDINYSGGGGAEEMTLAQYNELSQAEKNDGKIRFITDVDAGITWELAGQVTSGTAISLPSDFNELLIESDLQGNGTVCLTIHVIRQMLTNTVRNYRAGYEWTTQYYGAVEIDITLSSVQVIGASLNGNSVFSTVITKVYYR